MSITKEATSPTVGNAEDLDKILGGEEATAEQETETQEQEDAENSGEETEGAEQETQGEEEATEEEAEETATEEEGESTEEAEEEAEQEETDLSIDESDRDYSDAAYKKAADHYARTKKIELNPEDPAHRALLKEIMDRGEALKRQRTEKEEADAAKKATEEAAPKAEEQPTRKPPTAEEIKAFTDNARTVAKSRIVPEVAMHVASELVPALSMLIWPQMFNDDGSLTEQAKEQEFGLPKITQARATRLAEVLSAFSWMQLEDQLPAILAQNRQSLSGDPVFGQVEQHTINAQAFEQMDGMKDKTTGKKLYPDIEQMVESGTLRKVLTDNPEISKLKAGDGRDRVANQLLRYQTAYKIARGESVNLQTVSTAVNTGKKQAETRAKKIASGRVSSGKPSGGFSKGPSQVQQVVSDITGGSGSKFSAAVAAAKKVR